MSRRPAEKPHSARVPLSNDAGLLVLGNAARCRDNSALHSPVLNEHIGMMSATEILAQIRLLQGHKDDLTKTMKEHLKFLTDTVNKQIMTPMAAVLKRIDGLEISQPEANLRLENEFLDMENEFLDMKKAVSNRREEITEEIEKEIGKLIGQMGGSLNQRIEEGFATTAESVKTLKGEFEAALKEKDKVVKKSFAAITLNDISRGSRLSEHISRVEEFGQKTREFQEQKTSKNGKRNKILVQETEELETRLVQETEELETRLVRRIDENLITTQNRDEEWTRFMKEHEITMQQMVADVQARISSLTFVVRNNKLTIDDCNADVVRSVSHNSTNATAIDELNVAYEDLSLRLQGQNIMLGERIDDITKKLAKLQPKS